MRCSSAAGDAWLVWLVQRCAAVQQRGWWRVVRHVHAGCDSRQHLLSDVCWTALAAVLTLRRTRMSLLCSVLSMRPATSDGSAVLLR